MHIIPTEGRADGERGPRITVLRIAEIGCVLGSPSLKHT